MKTLIILLFFSVCTSSNLYSQTQRDQELSWVKEIYAKDYTPKVYPKFRGFIKKENSFSYRFNDRIIMLYEKSQELDYILLNGLFYPQLITGDSTIKADQEKGNGLTKILQNDTLILGNFKEVFPETKDFKTKRFSFYISNKGIMNPSLYTLEISNDIGRQQPFLATFYKSAKVTFWKFVSVLL